jgi:hypothetical protein
MLLPPDSGSPEGEQPRLALAAWLDRMGALEIHEIRLSASVTRSIRVRDPYCTVVRGLFGDRLRDFRCLSRALTCLECRETSQCDYARIIGVEESGGSSSPTDVQPVHPYWLQGLVANTEIQKGTQIAACLRAIASPVAVMPYLDAALRDALVRAGGFVRDPLVRTVSLGASKIAPVSLPEFSSWTSNQPLEHVRIETITPVLLRGDRAAGRDLCPNAPWLGMLVRAGVRRIDALVRGYAPGVPQARVEFPSLQDVRVISGELKPWRGSRFSQRQGQRTPFAGLEGSVVIAGNGVAAIAPLLAALEIINVGKTTSMGFGNLRVEFGA